MPIKPTQFIWFNGKLVPWEKATVHVMAHALHYGSSVFEGIRSYATPQGPCIFRLTDHAHRLFDSAKIYSIEMPYDAQQIIAACKTVVVGKWADQGRVPAADRVSRLRRNRRYAQGRPADRGGHCGNRMGRLSRRRGAAERRRRLRIVLAARGTQHHSRARQGRRQLPVEPAHRHGSSPPRVCRRHRPHARRTGERRRRREPVPRQGRRHPHARPRLLDPRWHHARFGRTPRTRTQLRSARKLDPARDAVSGRRAVLHRHGRGDHADSLRRRDPDRRREAGPDHASPAERLLRPVRGPHARQVGLARPGSTTRE